MKEKSEIELNNNKINNGIILFCLFIFLKFSESNPRKR